MSEEATIYRLDDRAPEDVTRARILAAAFACAERFGVGRTTIADVAKEARLSRQTVYRYFPNRHELFAALVLREEARMVDGVRRAIAPYEDLSSALQAALVTALRAMRAHPLLDKVMATEPQELLPFLTVEANPVLDLAMRLMEEVFVTRAAGSRPDLIRRAAETCARVLVSYAITPPTEDEHDVARTLARVLCYGLLEDIT